MNFDFSPSEVLFDFFLKRKKIYVYGATSQASVLIDKYRNNIIGVIDRSLAIGSEYKGVEVVDSESFCDNSLVINAIVCAHTGDIEKVINSKGAVCVSIYDFFFLISDKSHINIFSKDGNISEWSDFTNYFIKNIDGFNIKDLFSDETSREVYRQYLDARIVGDPIVLGRNHSFIEPNKMYVQDFLPDLNGYSFVDIGGYDGGNTEFFTHKYPDSKAYVFEAEKQQYKSIEEKFRNNKNVSIHNFFIGDGSGDVTLLKAGSSSREISSSESDYEYEQIEKCEKISLDDFFKSKDFGKLFIKMDVEGAELDVLRGMRKIGTMDNIIAISMYHKNEDFIEIYPWIVKYSVNKKVYLRHLTSGACETVLFIF